MLGTSADYEAASRLVEALSPAQRSVFMRALEDHQGAGEARPLGGLVPLPMIVAAVVVGAVAILAGVACALVRTRSQVAREVVHIRAPSVQSWTMTTATADDANTRDDSSPGSDAHAIIRRVRGRTSSVLRKPSTAALSASAALASIALAARTSPLLPIRRRMSAPEPQRRDCHGVPMTAAHVVVVDDATVPQHPKRRATAVPLGVIPESSAQPPQTALLRRVGSADAPRPEPPRRPSKRRTVSWVAEYAMGEDAHVGGGGPPLDLSDSGLPPV